MFRPRIIPVLLLKEQGLVKTVKFKNPNYIGDPINAVYIFNDMKADELIFLDISASPNRKKPDFQLMKQIGNEAYMPFAVGGNINTEEDFRNCMNAGAEKIVLNSVVFYDPNFVTRITDLYGKQSVVVSIDVKTNWLGKKHVYVKCGGVNTKIDPVSYAKKAEELGAGEIMINSIDQDGMMSGYDIELIESVSKAVDIPVIAAGGAGKLEDLKTAVKNGGASAASAGSLFVYQGARKGVLINYPSNKELDNLFQLK